MPEQIVVTACGVVSPLGFGWEENRRALLENPQSAIRRITLFSTEGNRASTAGEIDNARLENFRSDTRAAKRLHRASLMMIAAARELSAADSEFTPESVFIGTTSGGMSHGEAFYERLVAGNSLRGAATEVANYMPHKPITDALADRAWTCPVRIVSNACASGTNAIGLALLALRSGRITRAIAGGYDALAQLVFCGFDALQAASATTCRPFDRDRNGLALGEAAALLALETRSSAEARGAKILCEIAGYGAATDTHHLTQPHPSGIGPRMAMERALADAKWNASQVDYINAHGTATPLNDASEGAAINALFASNIAVSSTKGFVGHTLGAAGALEAVFCIMALREQCAPPNLNWQSPDSAFAFQPLKTATRLPLQRILSNSFGFGGANATVALSRVDH